jgi:hypothetical protein
LNGPMFVLPGDLRRDFVSAATVSRDLPMIAAAKTVPANDLKGVFA